MILRTTCLQKTLQVTVCAVFAAFLLVPLSGQAAATKQSASKSKKPVAAKVVVRKKVTGSSLSRSKVVVSKTHRSSTTASSRKAVRISAKSGAKKSKFVVQAKSGRASAKSFASKRAVNASLVRVAVQPRVSEGERLGLRGSDDALDLNSSVALVIDQDTGDVLFSKNESAVLPIASLTKLMTGLVIADANLPMDEPITITQDDVDTFKGSRSRLSVGTTLSRGELMHLALMSSENRAAHALGRTYPGGMQQFVKLMNSKAHDLGMNDTRYVEPTGLLSWNQSSARDLATLVSVAYERPILRSLSTSPSHEVDLGNRTLQYNNSNRLIRNPDWDIGLQKTGYISEAGRCLVMQTKVAGRKLIMVLLDSQGRSSRSQDAERVRRWVEVQSFQKASGRPQG
jgi:serine-type D-Ala-D-Ala endopeptidase (penicillin-binding protein 7)